MKLTATEFRKNLFPLLERARKGETIEVFYKGSPLKVTAAVAPSKLARLRPQPLFLCDPGSIADSDPELLAEMEAEWTKDWEEL